MSEEHRLIAIETKIAYHEDLVQTLNDTVIDQQMRIAELEARYQALLDRMSALHPPADPAEMGDERPPHY